MKKVLAILVTLMMVFSVTVNTMAAGFVESPSNNPGPEIIEGGAESDDCTGTIVVVPFSERFTLPDDERKEMEDAYNIIVGTDDLTTLNGDLKNLADDKGINGKDLSASDLFALALKDCDDHTNHGGFNLKMKAGTLKDFVGLLRFDGKNWHLVKDAKANDDILSFNTNELGCFAILVGKSTVKPPVDNKDESSKDESSQVGGTEVSKPDKTEKPQANTSKPQTESSKDSTPKTGESNQIYLWIMLFAVSAILIIVLVFKRKKQNEES